ncbi:hypothetical protein SK128_022699 [Halocaridina rubra]|uniref:Uncharacterized protein n=1 Tax=Halocaridina rubra TaxID=373956 RepID=A0AAN8WN43_HALRR
MAGDKRNQTEDFQQLKNYRDDVNVEVSSEERYEKGSSNTAPKKNVTEFKRTPSSDDDGQTNDVEVKRSRSIGSFLAGLASGSFEHSKRHFSSSSDDHRDSSRRDDERDSSRKDDIRDSSRRGEREWSRKDTPEYSRRGSDHWSRRSNNDNSWKGNRDRLHKYNSPRVEKNVDDDEEDTCYKPVDIPIIKEENNVIYVRGHKPRPKLSEKEKDELNKALVNNMSFQEEARASPNPPLWCPTTAVPASKQLKLSVLDGNRSIDLVNAKPARYHCTSILLYIFLPHRNAFIPKYSRYEL